MTIPVEHFGLHWDKSVPWLLQGRKGSNFAGLKAQCPFSSPRGMCNHLIPTAAPVPDRLHWDMWMRVFKDPLVQAMLPLPHDEAHRVFYVEDPNEDLRLYLATLSRLSSPIKQVIKPAWLMKLKQLETELTTTNLQPLVLVQVDQKSQGLLDMVGKMSAYIPRTTVFVGKPEVVVRTPIRRIETDILSFDEADLMTLPLENIGAAMIRRYARREELDAPWETREDRRKRQIQERS